MYTVRVLQYDSDGLIDFGSSRSKLIQCDDVGFDGPWVCISTKNPDGSLTFTRIAIELVSEITQTVPANEVKRVNRMRRKMETARDKFFNGKKQDDQRGYA